MPSLLSPLADLGGVGADQPVWGIDTSTWRFSVGIIRPEPGFLATDSFTAGDGWAVSTTHLPRAEDGPRRQAIFREHLLRYFGDLVAATGAPIFVLVETPFSRPGPGRNSVHPESFYVISTGVNALYDVLGRDTTIDYVEPSAWKLPAMGPGRGNSKKPAILEWARDELGYQGECDSCGNVPGGEVPLKCAKPKPAHDEADALGIAVAAARRLSTRGEVTE